MISRKFFQWLCIACVAAFTGKLQAQTLFGNPSGASVDIFTNSTIGATFTVGNSAVQVTALGVYDFGQDGLATNHTVGLWGPGSNFLTSVTIAAGTGSTLSGSYRYVTLGSPLTLSANTTYTIGAWFTVNHSVFDFVGRGGTSVLDPAFTSATTDLFDGFQVHSGLAEPTIHLQTYWAANMQLPEPSSIALLGAGMLCWRCARGRIKFRSP